MNEIIVRSVNIATIYVMNSFELVEVRIDGTGVVEYVFKRTDKKEDVDFQIQLAANIVKKARDKAKTRRVISKNEDKRFTKEIFKEFKQSTKQIIGAPRSKTNGVYKQ